MLDIAGIALGAVKALSPYLPTLVKLGKAVGGKVEDMAASGIKDEAIKLWNKLTGHYKDDEEVELAAKMVAAKPEDEGRQKTMAEVLAARLSKDEGLAQEIMDLIGGQKRVQEVVAGNESTVRLVRQYMEGAGKQSVKAGDKSHLTGIVQDMRR